MLLTLLQRCIVIVMQIKLTVVDVVARRKPLTVQDFCHL